MYRVGVWFGSVRFALLVAVVLCWVDRCFDSWVLLGLCCILRVTHPASPREAQHKIPREQAHNSNSSNNVDNDTAPTLATTTATGSDSGNSNDDDNDDLLHQYHEENLYKHSRTSIARHDLLIEHCSNAS